MNSAFLKNVMVSLALALALVVVVNVIGELSISLRTGTVDREPAAASKAPAAAEKTADIPDDLSALLAAYDPKAGKKAFRKCKACHTSDKGGARRVGPNLWDIVGREKGTADGYRFSTAMKTMGGSWGYRELNRFLANPRVYVRGTKMSIKGFSDPALRASLIGFLRELSDDPRPLPQ